MISLIKVPSQDGNRTNYVVEKWNSRLNALPASSSQNLSYSDEEEVLSIQEGNVDGFQKLNDLSHAVNDKKKGVVCTDGRLLNGEHQQRKKETIKIGDCSQLGEIYSILLTDCMAVSINESPLKSSITRNRRLEKSSNIF